MGSSNLSVKHFYSEPIAVQFSTPPARKKSPPCPSSFIWQDRIYNITHCLSEWKDFGRRGKMARNMQPQHSQYASQVGSWGVGRFYFEVVTQNKQIFRIYYDRAPKDANDRYGNWTLLAELSIEEG